ncbi:MAG: hypothetical protein NC218_12115 [Acetobacter sp.]|nr:hypothetical protein [Acetobacter sp.]
MLKLCLAFLFCLLSTLPAKADLNALFIRLECNRDLGIFDIQYNNIFEGAKAYKYFEKNKGVYKYNINNSTTSNADIEILNGYFYDEPYEFHCELTPTQKYDVTITDNQKINCLNDRGYIITLSRQLKEENTVRPLIKELAIGCESAISRITIVPDDDEDYDDSYSYIAFEQHNETHAALWKIESPITQETIIKYKIPVIDASEADIP